MDMPIPCLWLSPVAEFGNLYVFSWSHNAPGQVPTSPFCFPKGNADSSLCFFLAFRFGLAFYACSLAIYQSLPLPMLRAHIKSWAQDVWVGMSKACKMLGVVMGQFGRSMGKVLPPICGKASWWILQLLGFISFLYPLRVLSVTS